MEAREMQDRREAALIKWVVGGVRWKKVLVRRRDMW